MVQLSNESNLNHRILKSFITAYISLYFRALCELIGEKTNVYSLEVSMWGHDVKVRKELSKRELHKLGLTDMEKIPLEDKTVPYSKEDCKLQYQLKTQKLI